MGKAPISWTNFAEISPDMMWIRNDWRGSEKYIGTLFWFYVYNLVHLALTCHYDTWNDVWPLNRTHIHRVHPFILFQSSELLRCLHYNDDDVWLGCDHWSIQESFYSSHSKEIIHPCLICLPPPPPSFLPSPLYIFFPYIDEVHRIVCSFLHSLHNFDSNPLSSGIIDIK